MTTTSKALLHMVLKRYPDPVVSNGITHLYKAFTHKLEGLVLLKMSNQLRPEDKI